MMSSIRCKRNTPHTRPRENEHLKCRKCVPGLLRLDSTGEITSACEVSRLKNARVEGESFSKRDIRICQPNSYKNLVETLKMGTLINSASAYLGTAKSYIESFCPYRTSKGLVRSKSENSSSMRYFQNMLEGKSHSNHKNIGQEPFMNCNSSESKMGLETEKSLKWTDNIFGAIQSSLLNNCSAVSDKMKNTEKYVPPQRRGVQSITNNITTGVDPKLTPYNARLLEKSKRSHSQANVKRDCLTGKPYNAYSPKMCKKNQQNQKQVANMEHEIAADNCKLKLEQTNETELDHIDPKALLNDEVISNENTTDSDVKTDWFEYECDSVNCIPISAEKIQVATQKSATNECSQGLDSNIQQLHSWFSIEYGSESSIAVKGDSSQIKNESEICDRAVNCLKDRKAYRVDKNLDMIETSDNVEAKNAQNKQNPLPGCVSKYNCKSDNDHSVSGNNNISVLYVRSLGKKRRPSAKKRRRQKAQQNESIEQTHTACDESDSDKNLKSSSRPNSAVAFILGYDSDNSDNVPSFHVSCDMDCDSDWTESDCESDENFSSLEDENLFGNELGFQCNDLLRNMHFKVTCSMQPTEKSIQSSNSSAIDDINMSWRVQVSVQPEVRKNNSSKKVHFPSDNDLATIHPIIAWSHAYQAARKGPWEQYARDRGRFLRRITDTEKVLIPVLNQNHRDNIFRERFSVK